MLHPYQQDAVSAALERFDAGEQRTALVLATGAGKTVIFSGLIQAWRQRHPSEPILVLAHRSELLSQAADEIRLWAPGVRVGLVQAGSNQVWADVVVASQQTLQRQSRIDRLPAFSLIVVDECHRAMSESYQKVLDALGATTPGGPKVLGVTATFTREDTKRLTEFFQSVAYSRDILDLIEDGYLVPPKFRRVLVEGLDLAAIRSSRLAGGKDLAADELDAAMERAGAAGVVAAAYRMHASDRPGFVFTPTVHSAELVRDALLAEGISSAMLSGKTPKGERAQVMRDFNAGRIQTIVNCALLTEGVNAPRTSCVVMARPTLSKILFRQVVGRGLRLFCPVTKHRPGETCEHCKTDCLVLDMVGATGRNDLRTLNDITDRPVDIKEGELLTDAVKRVGEPTPRTELIGDAMVSGSLQLVETDPWEVERKSKLTKRELAEESGAVYTLSDEERAQRDAELETKKAKQEAGQKVRYAHVPGRSGWFLRSLGAGIWFIPCVPSPVQSGFVCVIPDNDGMAPLPGERRRYHVAVQLPGINWREHLVTLDSEADAVQLALDLTLGLLPLPRQRDHIDPDARWRRRSATKNQLRLIYQIDRGDVDPEQIGYQGQAEDLITIARTGPSVDSFARVVASSLATV